MAIVRPAGEVLIEIEAAAATANGGGGQEVAFGRAALMAMMGEQPMLESVKIVEGDPPVSAPRTDP
ncbi:MAG: hypothetical protein Q7S40_19840 [Opitutaceae bacterium]|nr:hypothetical protein [Opitutaceae bacterium]